MSELEELLYRVGHRPAKHGKSWACAECPSGKTPALKVDAEVWFCHRCQKGGNVVMLRRELRIETYKTPPTKQEMRASVAAAATVEEIRGYQKRWRGFLIRKFQQSSDRLILKRDCGLKLIEAGQELSGEMIDEAYNASIERDYYESWLNWFDRLSNQELISEYKNFHAVMNESS